LSHNQWRLGGAAQAQRSRLVDARDFARGQRAVDEKNLVQETIHEAQAFSAADGQRRGQVRDGCGFALGSGQDTVGENAVEPIAAREGQMIPGVGQRSERRLGQEAGAKDGH
jgi:hypothetical protein